MEIKDHVFVITGGASGLGLATAQKLQDLEGQAVILDRNEEAALEVCQNNPSLGFIKTDVCIENEIQAAITQIKKKYGKISGLINCAGIGTPKRVVGKEGPQDLDFFQKIIQVNLVGTFNMIRLVVNEMQYNTVNDEGERGVVINTASIAAYEGQIGQVAYAASKGGIVSMTLPLAREFANMGIRVVTIAPGIFETPMLAELPHEARAALASQVPFPARLGRTAEYASLVEQIIKNPMLNGETIRIDGALRMNSK